MRKKTHYHRRKSDPLNQSIESGHGVADTSSDHGVSQAARHHAMAASIKKG